MIKHTCSVKKTKSSKLKRIFEAAVANAWSEMYLQTQNLMFSSEQFASPSAELNRVCNTSPPKLWHILSNI